MTLLALVRHGQTAWNLAGRIQGSSDIPLNDTGRGQAREAGLELSPFSWDALLASPLSRAVETAQLIGKQLGITKEVLRRPGLAERSYGEAEGLTGAEVTERFGSADVPGRESLQHVLDRVLPELDSIAAEFPGQRLVVVSHGGVIGALLRHLTDNELPRPGEFIRNGSVHLFRVTPSGVQLEHYAGDASLSEALSPS